MKHQTSFFIFLLLLNICFSVRYYPPCPTSYTSLVDGLNSVGVDSSFTNRKIIAFLNGITDYTGTAAQNTALLNLLKKGLLIKDNDSSDSDSSTDSNTLYMNRLKSSSSFSSKKDTLVTMGTFLLNSGYEPAFVAGVLGNIYAEADIGHFESSAYVTHPEEEPAYLVYMDKNYNYRSKYSGKSVTQVSLSELSNLMTKLSNAKWKGKFGLGCVQWTEARTKTLVDLYVSFANGNDKITLAQVTKAEAKMIAIEFKGKYEDVYTSWKTTHLINLKTATAAYDAGSTVCLKYEKPKDKESKAPTRADYAKEIYNIMMNY